MKALAKNCPRLRKLRASSIAGINDAALAALAAHAANLEEVDLRGCGRVGEAGVSELEHARPDCKIAVNGQMKSIW